MRLVLGCVKLVLTVDLCGCCCRDRPWSVLQSVSVGGLQVVNSDRQFMYLLKKHGFDPTMLAKYPDQVFNMVSAPVKQGGSGLRDFAQDVKNAEKQSIVLGPNFGILDISHGQNMQFLTRNPISRSKLNKFYSQEGKHKKKLT